MSRRSLILLGGVLMVMASLLRSARAEEETIDHCSPDKRYCMQTVGDCEVAGGISEVSLVSMPEKKRVADLLPPDDAGTTIQEIELVWSSDSKWCAFYYELPRVGSPSVLRMKNGAFARVEGVEDLRTKLADKMNDNLRKEFVRPLRWPKPGTLVLKQDSIFHGDPSDGHWILTARFDAKTEKFTIIKAQPKKQNANKGGSESARLHGERTM